MADTASTLEARLLPPDTRHADEDVATRVGALGLAIAERAARHSRLSNLSTDLLDLLGPALGLEEAALFWCRHRERPDGRPRPALHSVAAFSPAGELPPTRARHMKAQAYRALSAARPVARRDPREDADGGQSSSRSLALPLGTATPWAVLVAHWAVPTGEHEDCTEEILTRLAPSLAMATRPAHALDEAAHSEHQVSARRAIFAMSSEAILTVAEDFTIQEANPAFFKVTGWTERAAAGLRCSEVIRCRDERRTLLCDTPRCPLRQAFDASEPTPVRDVSWQSRSGRLCEVAASFTVQRMGSDTRAVIVARDVALLNAANRMRANFISMVSHELRTPLNSVNGFLEIVLDGQVGPLNERQKEFLGYAHLSTQQLATLVEDILLISKADSGQFTLRLDAVDMGKLVSQVTQALQPAAAHAEVQLVVTLPEDAPLLHADELRLQQVLSNLVSNAIKFSPANGTISVAVYLEEQALRFAVSDTGIGVAPEDHARIFERFYQSDTTSHSRTGGYGLGLAIAKLIVEQHNGRIWVESEPGHGATFSFTIPHGE